MTKPTPTSKVDEAERAWDDVFARQGRGWLLSLRRRKGNHEEMSVAFFGMLGNTCRFHR